MPDPLDDIVSALVEEAGRQGVDPNDAQALTQVALKYNSLQPEEARLDQSDILEINTRLHRLRGFNAQTGQEVKPEETWSQTIGESAAQGLRNALTVGNAVMATPELIASKLGVYDLPTSGGNDWSPASNFFKRVDETRALEEARAARERGLGQQFTGAVVEPLANPMTYAGAGAGRGVLMATQAGVQGVDRIRAGAIAGEENLAAKGAAAALIGGLGARSYGGVSRDIGANAALGGGQEVGESFIDNREIDPMTLALSGAGQVGASALGIGANAIADANIRATEAKTLIDAKAAIARQQADQIAAERAQAATDRRMLEHMPPSWDQVGVDYIRGADVLPDPLDPTGVLPARDAIELNRLRDEEAQAQLDAEEAAAIERDKLQQQPIRSLIQDVRLNREIAREKIADAKYRAENNLSDQEINDIAIRQANTIRDVVANRQLGPELRDSLLNRVKSWRAESLAAIARGEPSLPVPKLDELNVPSERNVQAETASMQQRQAVESDATRPLREANAESDAATLRAEIDNLRAELEAIKSGKSQALKQAEQQAIEADKALAAGEAAVVPDRQMVADADKTIRRAEYEMTGKTSPSGVAMQPPIGKQVEASRNLTPRQLAKRTDTPLAQDATAVVERPVDTTPVVESPNPVETPQPEVVAAKPETVVPEGKPGVHKVYHGTSKAEFQNLDPYIGEYGLFGGGTYWTSDPKIAKEYTTKGKGNTPGVYESSIEVKNPLDMDKPADIAKWKAALEGDDFVGQYVDLSGVTTNESVLRKIEDAMADRGDITRGDAQEIVQDFITKMGYDSITHVGGGRHASSKGNKHRVYITFDPEQVKTTRKISEQQSIPAKPEGKVNEEVRQETSPQQAPQEGEVLGDWKVYRDPITDKNKATRGEIPEGAKLVKRTEKNADIYDKIVDRSKAAEKRDPWNKARAGVTLSDVADVGRAIKSFLGLDADTQSASDVRGLRKTAAHASSMEIDRIVRENETDPTNSIANKEVEKRAKILADYNRKGVYGKSWFASIAEARGGDYRTVTRKIFNRELAADHIRWLNETAEGKKAEQGARQYFIDNGMTPDEARIVVDKIKQQHESPYMPSAVSDKGISKIRNNKMDPRLDKFFGKIENPKDQLAMTLSLQERAINQIKHNEKVIAEGTAKGWLKDAKSAPSGYKVIEINGANYYVKPELQHIVELEVNGPESLISSVLRSVDSTGRVLVTAGSGVQFVARTLMGNAWTAANTGMFVNPKKVAQAFKTAAAKLELVKRKSDEHLNLVRDGVILETGAGTYGMQREALAGGKPSIGDKSNKIANWLFKPSTTVDNAFRLATYELRKDVLRDLNPDITPDELHAKAAEYVRNALPTPQNALPAVQKMRKIPLIPTFLTYPTEAAIRNPLNILKYSVDDMKSAIETKNAAKIAAASSRLALSIAAMGAAAGAVEALSGKDLSEEKKKSIRQLGGFSQNDSLYFLPDGKNAISLSSINPFDLTVKNLNALRDKAGLMSEPDGLALYGENVRNTLVSSFVGSPGLSAIGVALNPAQNQSRFEAPLQLVPAPVRKAISNNDIAELRPLVTAENALRTVVPKEEADVKKKLGFEAKLAKLNRNYEFGKFFKNGSDMAAAEKAVKEMADDYDGIVRAVRNAKEVGGYDDVKLHSMLATAIPRFEDREAVIRGERPYVDTPEQFMLKLKVAELRRRAQLYVQLKQDPELADKYRDQIPDSARAYKLMSKIGKYISKARDEGASPELIKRLDSLLEEQLKAQPQ